MLRNRCHHLSVCWASILLVGLSSAALPASEAKWIGYRGDGSGIFPDVQPPTSPGPDKHRWTAVLPSWGHGSAIVVGDRVFALVESSDTFAVDEHNCPWPQLVCLDLQRGKQLWTAVLDPLESSRCSPADRQEVFGRWRQVLMLTSLHNLKQAKGYTEGQEAIRAIEAHLAQHGLVGDKNLTHQDKGASKLLERFGLFEATWHEDNVRFGVGCIGQAYATPVSDGETVYTATAQGHYAAFDLEGKRLWEAHYPGLDAKFESAARSPIIHGDLLISDLMDRVRAIDRHTGRLLWSKDFRSSSIATPDVLTVDGRDILWSAGGAFLLPSGQELQREGWQIAGMQILVKYDERDVAFFCGEGEHCGWPDKGNSPPFPPAAVRFSLTGSSLTGDILWHGIGGEGWGGNKPWMTCYEGYLILPGRGVAEASTGKVVERAVPDTKHYLLIAGGHAYTGDRNEEGLTITVAKPSGGSVSEHLVVPYDFADTDLERHLIAHNHGKAYPQWGEKHSSYSYTMAFGRDCLLVRTTSRLYCFGR